MKKLIPLLCLLLPFASGAQSIERQIVASAGGSASAGSNFRIDYTIGDVAVSTLSGGSHFLTQGFQQPSSSSVFINENPENPFIISIYPNPVREDFLVTVQNVSSGRIKVQVFDIVGQLVVDATPVEVASGAAQVIVPASGLATGTYYVRVMHNNTLLATSKIVRINQ